MALILVTPIPPVRSGTADYFKTFLNNTLKIYPAEELVIVIDPADYKFSVQEYLGVKVVSYENFVFTSDDIVLFFTSNNSYHHYIFKLIQSDIPQKKIAIVHDVQCAMSAMKVMLDKKHGFSTNSFQEFFGYETTQKGKFETYNFDRFARLPHIVRYLAAAQDYIIDRVDEIWVHSFYAFSKLGFECGALAKGKIIKVLQMPMDYDHLKESSSVRIRHSKFRVGVFGFVAPHKRVIPIVKGFAGFLSDLTMAERSQVELVIVGENEQKEHYAPEKTAAELYISEYVSFTGFVTLQTMEEMIKSCFVIFNLRFPSCGETSATLNRARDLGVKVVGSRYQAFAEEEMDEFCSVESELEIFDIQRVLRKYFRQFQDGFETSEARLNSYAPKYSAVELLSQLKGSL